MTNTPGEGQPSDQPYSQNPYPAPQQPGYYPPQGTQYAPDHPQATTALVLGILGVVLCQVAAPFAWWMGKKVMNEIDASQGRLSGRGLANAGYICGIVGTILLGLAVLVMVGFFALFLLTAAATTSP